MLRGQPAVTEWASKENMLPWWLGGKESACNARDPGLVPGWGSSPGEGKGNPLQYPSLKNSLDRGAWQATGLGVVKSRAQVSDFLSWFGSCDHTGGEQS